MSFAYAAAPAVLYRIGYLPDLFTRRPPRHGAIIDDVDPAAIHEGGRFDDPDGHFPTLYFANTPITAFAETIHNLRVAGRHRSRRATAQRMRGIFEHFPVLCERRGQKAKLLSGGERQMLALASAMMDEPRLLIRDEPTTGLAPSIVRQLIDQIVAMRQTGRTILWIVEESLLLVLPYVDRVYLLKSGVIEREMPASAVVNSEELHRIFFGVAEPLRTWSEAPR